MRIVVDGRLWSQSGSGRYIRNLVNKLRVLDKKNEYFVLLLKKDIDKFAKSNNFYAIEADFLWYGWEEQIKLPPLLRNLKPDLVHFPHFNVPVIYRGKYIVTIHDLIHQHFQMQRATTKGPFSYFVKRMGYKLAFPKAVRKSLHIITPSGYVKSSLIREWGVPESKITVTYEGVDDSILSFVNRGGLESADLEKKFKVKGRYLFYVGNAHPHKNIPMLVNVFKKIKESNPDLNLVLSGANNYFWEQTKKMFRDAKGLVFTGFVSEEELAFLYKNALAFVMPSLEEGFGIPILEAMALSCPVISSSAASLPEVGGDACIYFDPRDETDMEDKINSLLKDKELRKKLVAKGLKRYKEFSWEKMAKETLEVYSRCA